MAGLYIHIPFCKSKCIYCGFYSIPGCTELQDHYIESLIKEKRNRMEYLCGENIDTIYIGGGTPSLLTNSSLLRLGKELTCEMPVTEFTMECNPNDISDDLCETIRAIGVNRVSMGVQTFSNERLRFLHRRHRSDEITPAIDRLHHAGIDNISIDLMFGFPGETIEEWKKDLDKAIATGADHISAYSLMYEEGTPLFTMLEHGDIQENEEERSAEMYDMLIDTLTTNGYEHYEISNFAKPGRRSVHNSNYWNGTKYLGIGAAAHSYNGTTREWNISDVKKYIAGINNGDAIRESEYIDENTRYNDMVTTALRTNDGIDLSTLSERYYIYIKRYARKGLQNGHLEMKGNRLRLTRKGLYISDEIMSELIYVDE